MVKTVENVDDVRRVLSGKSTQPPPSDKKRNRRGGYPPRHRDSPKTGKPLASERSSRLAQSWYDLGRQEGFEFPYDVNYLALALQRRVERDKEMRPFLLAGKHDQVERWVQKMIDIWWNRVDDEGNGGYLTNEISQRNAKDFFLDTDWEDLRDYARSCLRAAYLVEHHRPVPKPIYLSQQEYDERLAEVRKRHQMDRWHQQVEENPGPERDEMDNDARERLRSWVTKRRKK